MKREESLEFMLRLAHASLHRSASVLALVTSENDQERVAALREARVVETLIKAGIEPKLTAHPDDIQSARAFMDRVIGSKLGKLGERIRRALGG